jgi:hypothetical protein
MPIITPEERVVSELETFRREVSAAAQFLYAQMTINHRARVSRRVLQALNQTPLFWNTVAASLQLSAFIALGRIFDNDSPHNVNTVLRAFQRYPEVFTREALAERKRRGSANADEWLPGYLARVHIPTPDDFRRLRKLVAEYRRVYETQFADIRNKIYAHKNLVDDNEVATLFGNARTRDLERVVVFVNELYLALWELLQNGRKPEPRRRRPSSSRHLARQPNYRLQSSRVPEMMVRETKECNRM